MNYYQSAVKSIKEDGYGIGIEKYTNGVTIYSLIKIHEDKSWTTKFELARNIAQMLLKDGAKIIKKRGNIKALNFTPERVPHNCIRYFTN